MARGDFFLKIDGIAGESKDAQHQGEIDIDHFLWSERQKGSAATGGGSGAGKVQFSAVRLTMRASKASPELMLACATGQHFSNAVLTLRKAGKTQQEYARYIFSDVLVSAYECSSIVPGDTPLDEINLNFAKVEFEYKEQKHDGSMGPAVKAGWNAKENKAV